MPALPINLFEPFWFRAAYLHLKASLSRIQTPLPETCDLAAIVPTAIVIILASLRGTLLYALSGELLIGFRMDEFGLGCACCRHSKNR